MTRAYLFMSHMSAPSEPEKYSIDEMMERLKNQAAQDSSADHELVTRADGSQAIRVRKRKRRSEQPHQDRRRKSLRTRMLQVSGVLVLLLLVIVLAGAAIVFANSAPFRQQICEQITRSSGASAELEQFRMNPTSANIGRVTLAWPEASALQQLTLTTVTAQISPSSFLGQSLSGDDVTVAEGSLILRTNPAPATSQSTPPSASHRPINFNRYAITKTQVLLGESTAPLVHMQNAESSFSPVTVNDRAQLLLSGGDVTIRGWPKLRMDRSHIEFRGSEMDIVSMRLRHPNDRQGTLELSGTVVPHTIQDTSRFAIHLESYLLSGLAGPELGRLITGRIDTHADDTGNLLTLRLGHEPSLTLTAAFHNSPASALELSGFPFLFGLAQTIGDDWFEHPVFDNAGSGAIQITNGQVVLRDLAIETKDRLAVRGALTMTSDRKLSGTLDIGVATAMIQASKSHRILDSLFSPPTENFRWLTLKIGGTASAPTDNFKELFQATVPAIPTNSDAQVPTFEELTRPK